MWGATCVWKVRKSSVEVPPPEVPRRRSRCGRLGPSCRCQCGPGRSRRPWPHGRSEGWRRGPTSAQRFGDLPSGCAQFLHGDVAEMRSVAHAQLGQRADECGSVPASVMLDHGGLAHAPRHHDQPGETMPTPRHRCGTCTTIGNVTTAFGSMLIATGALASAMFPFAEHVRAFGCHSADQVVGAVAERGPHGRRPTVPTRPPQHRWRCEPRPPRCRPHQPADQPGLQRRRARRVRTSRRPDRRSGCSATPLR